MFAQQASREAPSSPPLLIPSTPISSPYSFHDDDETMNVEKDVAKKQESRLMQLPLRKKTRSRLNHRVSAKDVDAAADNDTTASHESELSIASTVKQSNVSRKEVTSPKRWSPRRLLRRGHGHHQEESHKTPSEVVSDNTKKKKQSPHWVKVGSVHWIKEGTEPEYMAKLEQAAKEHEKNALPGKECKGALSDTNLPDTMSPVTPPGLLENVTRQDKPSVAVKRLLRRSKDQNATEAWYKVTGSQQENRADPPDGARSMQMVFFDSESKESTPIPTSMDIMKEMSQERSEPRHIKTVRFSSEVSILGQADDHSGELTAANANGDDVCEDDDDFAPSSLCLGGWIGDICDSETSEDVAVVVVSNESFRECSSGLPTFNLARASKPPKMKLNESTDSPTNQPSPPGRVSPVPLQEKSSSDASLSSVSGSIDQALSNSIGHGDEERDPWDANESSEHTGGSDRVDLEISPISRRGRMWTKIVDYLRAVILFVGYAFVVAQTPLCGKETRLFVGIKLAGAFILCCLACMSTEGHHGRMGCTKLLEVVYSRKTFLLLIYVCAWSYIVDTTVEPFLEVAECRNGKSDWPGLSGETVMNKFAALTVPYAKVVKSIFRENHRLSEKIVPPGDRESLFAEKAPDSEDDAVAADTDEALKRILEVKDEKEETVEETPQESDEDDINQANSVTHSEGTNSAGVLVDVVKRNDDDENEQFESFGDEPETEPEQGSKRVSDQDDSVGSLDVLVREEIVAEETLQESDDSETNQANNVRHSEGTDSAGVLVDVAKRNDDDENEPFESFGDEPETEPEQESKRVSDQDDSVGSLNDLLREEIVAEETPQESDEDETNQANSVRHSEGTNSAGVLIDVVKRNDDDENEQFESFGDEPETEPEQGSKRVADQDDSVGSLDDLVREEMTASTNDVSSLNTLLSREPESDTEAPAYKVAELSDETSTNIVDTYSTVVVKVMESEHVVFSPNDGLQSGTEEAAEGLVKKDAPAKTVDTEALGLAESEFDKASPKQEDINGETIDDNKTESSFSDAESNAEDKSSSNEESLPRLVGVLGAEESSINSVIRDDSVEDMDVRASSGNSFHKPLLSDESDTVAEVAIERNSNQLTIDRADISEMEEPSILMYSEEEDTAALNIQDGTEVIAGDDGVLMGSPSGEPESFADTFERKTAETNDPLETGVGPTDKSTEEDTPSTAADAAHSQAEFSRRLPSRLTPPFATSTSMVERGKKTSIPSACDRSPMNLFDTKVSLQPSSLPTQCTNEGTPTRLRDMVLPTVSLIVKGSLRHSVAFWFGVNGKFKNQEMMDALSEVWRSKFWL